MAFPKAFSRRMFQQVRMYSAPLEGAIPASKQKYVPIAGTYPAGFRVSGSHVGVKASNTSTPDLALIISDPPCAAAAVFTRNRCQAAPVTVCKKVLEASAGEGIHGIIINSGCANAMTGQGGMADAEAMARTVDVALSPRKAELHADKTVSDLRTLVMSTGVIGQRLPIDKILNAVPSAASSLQSDHTSWLAAARAICTTDTFPKFMSTTFNLPSSPGIAYSLAGMTKGAGMIHPNMATLLGILCTDAPISAPVLQQCLQVAVDESFNAISVDGDTSTNDTVALLANGAKGGQPLNPDDHSSSSPDIAAFQTVLTSFARSLSHLVVRDGEGATKFVRIRVINPNIPPPSSTISTNSRSAAIQDARTIASSIARSPLVKTALYGRDANWGRILCAVGYTTGLSHEAAVVPERTSVSFVRRAQSSQGQKPSSLKLGPVSSTSENESGPVLEVLKLLVNGEPQAVDEAKAAEILSDEDLEILVDMGGDQTLDSQARGEGLEASYWTCDLSHEYVTINGDYRT